MKKFIAFVAAAIMAFALCACEKRPVVDAVTTNVPAIETPAETLEAETEIETIG